MTNHLKFATASQLAGPKFPPKCNAIDVNILSSNMLTLAFATVDGKSSCGNAPVTSSLYISIG